MTRCDSGDTETAKFRYKPTQDYIYCFDNILIYVTPFANLIEPITLKKYMFLFIFNLNSTSVLTFRPRELAILHGRTSPVQLHKYI